MPIEQAKPPKTTRPTTNNRSLKPLLHPMSIPRNLLISRIRLSRNAIELGVLAPDDVSNDLAGHVDALDGVEGSRTRKKDDNVSKTFEIVLRARDLGNATYRFCSISSSSLSSSLSASNWNFERSSKLAF